MKNYLFTLIVIFATTFLWAQHETTSSVSMVAQQSEKTTSSMVKFINHSFKSYHLVIPNYLEIESVIWGSNTFCMSEGQEIFFVHEGQNYLLTSNSKTSEKQVYNLPKLVKQRKKELGLD
ncbi:MAG: hypothetical protein ACSHXL_05990 [Bacteroidota bacterium]